MMTFASISHAQVSVTDPWVRATVAEQKSAGAFMHLTAQSDSKLISAASSAAEHVEIHKMAMENDVMKMRQIPELALPANQQVTLEPGSYHIMLLGLKKQVNPGDEVPLALTVEDMKGERQQINIRAIAKPLQGGQHNHHH
jgi:copper(I)-binding protein